MSLQTSQKTTTYRTVKVASPEMVTNTVVSPRSVSPAVSVSTAGSVSPMPYTTVNGYETVRYLVPMQQQSYIPMQQAVQQQSYVLMQQPMMQQPMMQQVVSPVYLQGLQNLSVSSQESNALYRQQSTVEVSPMFSCSS